jgi:Ca2+-transporting ATPase
LTTQTIFLFHSNLSDVGKARTIALATFTLSAMFACLVCRSERLSIFKLGFFRNRELLFALLSTVFLLLLILYLPALSRLFATSSLSLSEWLLVILFTFPTLLLGELVKRII